MIEYKLIYKKYTRKLKFIISISVKIDKTIIN
jgi:hypothetical protein